MKNFKTVNIKGKEYVPVNERIKHFRTDKNYDGYSLESEIIELTDAIITIKAIVKNAEGRVIATGFANESKNDGYINKTSYIENCETSAWGRALSNLGIGIDVSIASSDETNTAISKETNLQRAKPQPPKQLAAKPIKTLSITDTVKQKVKLVSTDKARWEKGVAYAKENKLEGLLTYFELSESDLTLMKNAIK
jgi:hypothetical protein